MTKKTYEKMYQEYLDSLERPVKELHEPLNFTVGEKVEVGNLKDVKIVDISEDGLLFIISYTAIESRTKKETPNTLMTTNWLKVMKINKETNLTAKDEISVKYNQASIRSLLVYTHDFGVNFNPEYQRDYVWEEQDKLNLIESIFNHIEIGKFSFIENSSKTWSKTGFSYEVVDGKQRLQTIVDFYEGKLKYKGLSYRDLSVSDRNHFLSYPVGLALLDEMEKEDVYRYFLYMNKHGKVMSEEHLKKIEDELKKLTEK